MYIRGVAILVQDFDCYSPGKKNVLGSQRELFSDVMMQGDRKLLITAPETAGPKGRTPVMLSTTRCVLRMKNYSDTPSNLERPTGRSRLSVSVVPCARRLGRVRRLL